MHDLRHPYTLRQGGCTDVARHGVPSRGIEMTGRWSSKKEKKIYITADLRDLTKLTGFPVSALLEQIKSQPVD